jgi:hypothetical protein
MPSPCARGRALESIEIVHIAPRDHDLAFDARGAGDRVTTISVIDIEMPSMMQPSSGSRSAPGAGSRRAGPRGAEAQIRPGARGLVVAVAIQVDGGAPGRSSSHLRARPACAITEILGCRCAARSREASLSFHGFWHGLWHGPRNLIIDRES